MPYKGSKNRIAENLIKQLPPAKHFYDLFGGGGAMTHCALLSGKYQFVHYNELDPLVFKGFKMFINGEFKTEKRWISREDFHRLKKTDPYVAICFSFGNDIRSYCYSKDTEKFKKAVHYSICYDENSLLSEYGLEIEYHSKDLKERRLELQRHISYLFKQNKLNPTILNYVNPRNGIISCVSSNNEKLERLNECNFGNNIILSNRSYSDVQIESDSVIYCDPPYQNTNKYNVRFNHDEFYNWARNQKNIYISEYRMPEDFKEVSSLKKTCSFNHSAKVTTEKLFTNINTSSFDEW